MIWSKVLASSSRGGDPNFPEGGLDIAPSYARYGRRQSGEGGKEAPVAAAEGRWGTGGWARDSREDIAKYGIAGRVWEAAYVLQRYMTAESDLEFDPPFLPLSSSALHAAQSSVVELGAGAGVAGIHLGRSLGTLAEERNGWNAPTVILTDLENVLPLLERNVARSGVSRFEQGQVKVRALPWGSDDHADAIIHEQQRLQAPLRHVICSDLVYFPELLPPLLRSLVHLTSSTQADVTISYKIRSLAKEEPFWRAFGVWFDFRPILCRKHTHAAKIDDWRRFGSLKADLFDACSDAEAEAEDDIFVFYATRRRETLACAVPASDVDLMAGQIITRDGHTLSGTGSEQFELIIFNALQG